MVEAKLAATIMVVRDNKGVLEVLLLKRNKALAFAGGLWVFPGGKVEKNELEAAKSELEAAKLAAVRETKEETNIDIAPDQLLFFRHWTTPLDAPRRFATYFFFSTTEASTSDVLIDDSEIKAHQWLSPKAALAQLGEKKLPMMPPTIMSLQLISKCTSAEEARALILREQPIFVLPTVQVVAGKFICMYEGDAGYDSGNAALTGARHRLIMDVAQGAIDFEFHGCEDGILPVNGGMHV